MGKTIVPLFDFHLWANKRIFTRIKELPKGTAQKEIASVFPSIQKTMEHVYLTDHTWYQILLGKNFEEVRQWTAERSQEIVGIELTELEKKYTTLSSNFRNFLIEQENQGNQVNLFHPSYGALETELEEIVRHVVNHGTYHRGNIAAMIRQLGYEGVATDYIYYLYENSVKQN
ncbi:DinB family protein [Risungbinella massiliensis]|uniref:DinB family protein n=1 Tax=Risungbinella massiliensis TaxID=1329796 RepID=UPI0005CBB417|nr:DinB family protein [Risungbinella massiliensis]